MTLRVAGVCPDAAALRAVAQEAKRGAQTGGVGAPPPRAGPGHPVPVPCVPGGLSGWP